MRRLVMGFLLAPLATPVAIWLVFTSAYALQLGPFAGQTYGRVTAGVRTWSSLGVPLAYWEASKSSVALSPLVEEVTDLEE